MSGNGCSFKGDGSKCEAAHYYLLNKEEEPNEKKKERRSVCMNVPLGQSETVVGKGAR